VISQTAVTFTFVPFAIALAIALLVPEQSDTLDHGRLIFASWVSLACSAVALCLFVFPSTRNGQYELLTWTLGFAAYLVHFYFAFGVKYGFSVPRTYAAQGVVIATSNFLLTALWTFDVAAGWAVRGVPRWQVIERAVVRALVFVTFVMSGVVIFSGPVRVLGIAMIAAIALCVAVRLADLFGRRGVAHPSEPLATEGR
jgi:hypothetical protein